MVNGKLEVEMMIAHKRVINYSSWYQSKSIKERLKESEPDYLSALMESGMVLDEKIPIIQHKINSIKRVFKNTLRRKQKFY